jgi:hypothetical protein
MFLKKGKTSSFKLKKRSGAIKGLLLVPILT